MEEKKCRNCDMWTNTGGGICRLNPTPVHTSENDLCGQWREKNIVKVNESKDTRELLSE